MIWKIVTEIKMKLCTKKCLLEILSEQWNEARTDGRHDAKVRAIIEWS